MDEYGPLRVRAALQCLGNRYTKGDALMGELISTFPLYLVTNDDLGKKNSDTFSICRAVRLADPKSVTISGLLGSRVRAQRCLMSSNAQL